MADVTYGHKILQQSQSSAKSVSYDPKQVADCLGVVESCYANLEQGRTEPCIDILCQLARLFSVTLDELIND